ncbi:MAG: TldD/PmbA family protein [Candidatus Thorarchaeota archaeon]
MGNEMRNNKQLLLDKAGLVLKEAEKIGASQAQVSIVLVNRNLTRLANSIIDQNVSENHANVRILLYFGLRAGTVESEVFDDIDLRKAVEQAASLARISPENLEFKSLPSPKSYSTDLDLRDLVSEDTRNTTPEQRAELAKLAIDTAHEVDSRINAVAGYVQNVSSERVVSNSLGIEGYEMRTYADTELTIIARDGTEEATGWATDASRKIGELKVESVSNVAAEKAANGFGKKDLQPGEYNVILEPAAVADLLFYSVLIGFGARRHQEFMSYLRDRIGEQVFSPELTVWDNALDDRLVGASLFDEEGVPHQKVDLIEQGVVKNLVYDTLTASKDDVESTGNHSRWWGPAEPIARHIIVEEGEVQVEEMISDSKRAVLVTHFHYMNPVNPTEGVLTGLTRDGTWFIDAGEIQYPLNTLRFTDSIPRFFNRIDMIGSYSEFRETPPIGLVPAMKLPSFRFSGSSKE